MIPACRWAACGSTTSPPCTSKTGARGSQPRHRTGELVGITGATGAGKSCLLHLVAGFDSEFAGSIRRHGRVAHLGHKPWLMNDTIRNNILFGQPWHAERYRWVLGACALTADLALLSHGDQTLVGSSAPASRRPAAAGRPGSRPLRPGRYPAAGQPLVCARPHGRGPGTGAGLAFKPGPTRLLVSHDPDVLARCDRVIRIEQGRLAELDAHQLADLVQHPQPAPPVPPLRRRSSSARRKWWRARWTGGCLASCGSASPPPEPSCSSCCSPWARRGCASPRISGSAARPR